MVVISHVAFIMDGNRRYAKNKSLSANKGHQEGAQKLEEVMKWCEEKKIKRVSLYTFSIQNFSREEDEKNHLFELFFKYFEKWKKESKKKNVKIRFLGRIDLFPEKVQKVCYELEEATKEYEDLCVDFCFGYGGREEIVDACKKIVADVKKGELNEEELSTENFSKYLYSANEPEIVIRTGGDMRLSNFLSWQSAYSEWFFTKTLWPDFSKEEFEEILKNFSQRERRFGK